MTGVQAALAEAASRTAGLMRSGIDASAPVPGLSWNAGETAAHIVADIREHTALLTPEAAAPVGEGPVADAGGPTERSAAVNRAGLASLTERSLPALADLVEDAAAAYNAAAAAHSGQEAIITPNGVPMTPATLSAILLGEQLIHGLDLARSAHRPWPIGREQALLVIPGVMSVAPYYLDQQAARGVNVDYELRFGGAERYRFAVTDGTATATPADGRGRPDCVITADPAAFLLVGYGRAGQWGQILRGKLRAGGRKPWLAMRFGSLLSPP
jgi:hypothetical protein